MGDSIGFYDEVAAFGDSILDSLSTSQRSTIVSDYLNLVARPYEVLAQIHERVQDVAMDVELAETTEQAGQYLTKLDSGNLRSHLKAEDLCDELGMLGRDLMDALHKLRDAGQGSEYTSMAELIAQLAYREDGTAELYSEKLVELRSLPHQVQSLEELRTRVHAISAQLIHQKSSFDYLSKKARKLLEKR